MNFSIGIPGCAFCNEIKKAIILANCTLPTEKKVYPLDFHLGDSRLAFLDAKYPDGRAPLPITVIDNPFNWKGNFKTKRTLFMSSSLKGLDAQLISSLLA